MVMLLLRAGASTTTLDSSGERAFEKVHRQRNRWNARSLTHSWCEPLLHAALQLHTPEAAIQDYNYRGTQHIGFNIACRAATHATDTGTGPHTCSAQFPWDGGWDGACDRCGRKDVLIIKCACDSRFCQACGPAHEVAYDGCPFDENEGCPYLDVQHLNLKLNPTW